MLFFKKIFRVCFLLLFYTGMNNGFTQNPIATDFQDSIWFSQNVLNQLPPQITGDTMWYNINNDGRNDVNSRPGEWFLMNAFANIDSVSVFGTTNKVLSSSSTLDTVLPSDNWLIIRSYLCQNNSYLTWKSATYQSPYLHDGYEVLLSSNTNQLSDFTDTLFRSSEYISSTGNPNDFSGYQFNPSNGYIQGWNGVAMVPAELENSGDSSAWRGVLSTHTIYLTSYAMMPVYIAFHHFSTSDNMISIDDIILDHYTVTKENTPLLTDMNIFPNPCTDFFQCSFSLKKASPVLIRVNDINGKTVTEKLLGWTNPGMIKEKISIGEWANGPYLITVISGDGKAEKCFLKN